MRLLWLLAALLFSAALCALQWWAVTDFLYWRYEWFDILMHYLGGIAIAAFVIALLVRRRMNSFVAALVVLYVGWEVFEYVFGIQREANYALDTVIDLVMDSIGSLTAYGIARISIWRSA